MNNASLQAAVRYQVMKQRVLERVRNEEGEVGSWVLIAAFLAIAAVAAGTAISGWISTNTGRITSTGP